MSMAEVLPRAFVSAVCSWPSSGRNCASCLWLPWNESVTHLLVGKEKYHPKIVLIKNSEAKINLLFSLLFFFKKQFVS